MPEWIDKEKQEILEMNNYAYDFYRMIYFNSSERKVFSFEAIQDNPIEWLQDKIDELNETGEWAFNFNDVPSPEAQNELIEYLEEE